MGTGHVAMGKRFRPRAWLAPCLLAVLLPTLCCGLGAGVPIMYNNWLLGTFAANLHDYPLPADTEVLTADSEVGLMGSGNHCDFRASQTLASRLAPDAIQRYYHGVALPAVRSDSQYAQEGAVVVRLEFGPDLSDGRTQYTISISDIGYPAGLDIRCH